jgi:hypothetical protein
MGKGLDRDQIGMDVALVHHRQQREGQFAALYGTGVQDLARDFLVLPSEIVSPCALDHPLD